jgi:hypothetical protein
LPSATASISEYTVVEGYDRPLDLPPGAHLVVPITAGWPAP